MSKDLSHLIGDDYETIDGIPAKVVYASSAAQEYPLLVVVGEDDDEEQYSTWICENLTSYWNHKYPFIRRKPKRGTREFWVNIYPDGDFDSFVVKEEADSTEAYLRSRSGHYPRIACVKVVVEYEEGEGL